MRTTTTTNAVPPLPAGSSDDPITSVVAKLSDAIHGVPTRHTIPALCRLLAISCLHTPNPERVVAALPATIAGHFALVQRAVAEMRGERAQ